VIMTRVAGLESLVFGVVKNMVCPWAEFSAPQNPDSPMHEKAEQGL
jgi:hypothetical protein